MENSLFPVSRFLFSSYYVLIAIAVIAILMVIEISIYDCYDTKSRICTAQVGLVSLSIVVEMDYPIPMSYPIGCPYDGRQEKVLEIVDR